VLKKGFVCQVQKDRWWG